MDFDKKEKIHRILDLCLTAKDCGINAALYWFPHVNGVDVTIRPGEYDTDEYSNIYAYSLDGDEAMEKLNKIEGKLLEVIRREKK